MVTDDVITVGELVDSLKELDPLMWVCATIEGHEYPLTVCNLGVLKSNKPYNIKEHKEFGIFFIDIARASFVKFVEKEILDPLMQKKALEVLPSSSTVQ